MQTIWIVSRVWQLSPASVAVFLALLVLYLAAGRFSRTKFLFFWGAEALLALTVFSPLDYLARNYLFTAEALEHVLLALGVPYLFIVALPKRISFGIHRYLAFLIGMGVLLIWFLPGPLNAALDHEPIRAAEDVTLILAGVVFWWPIHAPAHERRIPLVPASLFYLVAATVWCSLMGLFLAFAQPWFYARYASPADPLHIANSLLIDWSFSRENDQQTGGLLFWIFAAAILLSEVMAVYIRWFRVPENAKSKLS